MARSVFFSFHYANDISRAMVVRNRWLSFGSQTASALLDHAEFEKIKQVGEKKVHEWIDAQLKYTSATVVLIGAETLRRPYVQYEICQSVIKGNAIIGVYINNIRNFDREVSIGDDKHTIIGMATDGSPVYFDDIADGIYDYMIDDGYNNLSVWVDKAVKSHQ